MTRGTPHGRDEIAAALDFAGSGIAMFNAEQRLVFANRHFLYALGLVESHTAGLSFEDMLEALSHSGELVLVGSARQWSASAAEEFGRDRSWEQPMADGRTLELTQRPDGRGGMVITLHDISGLKRVEYDLRAARDAAEASDESKSRFLRAANHDLRQPLATLKILIYSCLSESEEAHRKDLLHTMDISVSIMEDLLGALLQIGQLDAGQIITRISTFQLTQIFDRLRIQFSHLAAEKGLALRFVGTHYTVTSDKALLERMITNLVANAIRYTDVGKIVVGCRSAGETVRIEVWDSGRGISDEHLPRIFDEFYQIADGRRDKRPGLGLGLNIVKRLAGLLRHDISVRSKPGHGSLFAVTVPAGNVWHSEHNEVEVTEMNGGEFSGKSVLVIEDDAVLRHTMTELLERWGVAALAAADGAEAIRLLEQATQAPALIIADYSLREERGTEVVEDLRQRVLSRIPALIVTADVDPQITAEIRKAGIPMLIKPVSPPRLRVMMHNLLFEAPDGPNAG